MNPFGIHVMDNNVPDGEMWAYLHAARPALTVVLNNHDRAQAIKATFPKMHVVHRQYHPDDPRWFEKMTAQAWVDENARFGANGVIVACLNEPVGDFRDDHAFRKRFIDWCVSVIDASKRRFNVAIPNWSVGNPHDSTIENGGFDELIRAAATHDHVYWSSHEYWHDDLVKEYPFTIGRNEFWSDRAAELGLPPLRLLLTEYGMDTGGGGGDGWRNQGISDEEYAAQFKASRRVLVNKPPGAIYGFGEGFGWGSFNIAGSLVPELLKDYQEQPPVPDPIPTPTPPDEGIRAAVNAPDGVWLRRTPGGAAIRVLKYAEEVTVWAQPAVPSGIYTFIPVLTRQGEQGYAAQKVMIDNVWSDTFIPAKLPTGFTLKAPFRRYETTGRFNDPRDYSKIAPTKKQLHEGWDCIDANAVAYKTDPIVHVGAPGTVVEVGSDPKGYGNFVTVNHGNGFTSVYAHLAEIYVRSGQKLVDWQIIGLMGATGYVFGAHLHLTLSNPSIGLSGYVYPSVVDPEQYLVAA